MTSKILVLVLLVCTVSCQQEEDDGSYNAEKYEKPYENLVDDGSLQSQQIPSNQNLGFQQPQQFQSTPQQQPQQFQSIPQQQPQQFQSIPQEQPQQFQSIPQQQPQQFQAISQQQQQQFQAIPQQQQPSLFQQFQNSAPVQQQPNPALQNPFPQNPFFQQLQNSAPQRQAPSFQQQNLTPQNFQTFQPQNPSFQPQQQSRFAPTFSEPAPVNQFLDDEPIKSTNYRTNDGHQRSEIVDNDGNVKGEYSYVDPNGKTITVKYSAGKDGFRVEGDHIPKSPQPQPQQPQQQLTQIPQQFSSNQQLLQSRLNNPSPQQFFNPTQTRSQFNNLPSQFSNPQQPRFNPQVNQQLPTPLTYQKDGSFDFQSNFQ